MNDFKNLGLSDGTIARLEHEGIKTLRELMLWSNWRIESTIGTSCMIELATALPESFEEWRQENPSQDMLEAAVVMGPEFYANSRYLPASIRTPPHQPTPSGSDSATPATPDRNRPRNPTDPASDQSFA